MLKYNILKKREMIQCKAITSKYWRVQFLVSLKIYTFKYD